MAGTFKKSALTDKGIALLAKVQAGKTTLALTKAMAGNGDYDEADNLRLMTALKNPKQTFALNNIFVVDNSNVCVTIKMSNKQESGNLEVGYLVKEIGIYANDPDEGEILYALAIQEADKADYMPAYNSLMPAEMTVNYYLETANADETTIVAPNKMYLYDDADGEKFSLGINNGLLYYTKED